MFSFDWYGRDATGMSRVFIKKYMCMCVCEREFMINNVVLQRKLQLNEMEDS